MTVSQPTANAFEQLVDAAPVECPYCRKPLKRATVKVFGKTYNPPCFASCGCQKSLDVAEGKHLTAEEQRNNRYRAAGIGEAYLDAQVENPQHLQAVLDGKGLFVTGGIGTGKTHMASAIAMRMIDRSRTVKFTTAIGLLRELRDSFDGVPSTALDRAIDCDVLVLDDLGKEQATDFAIGILFELVDSRYANNRPIIATSNYQRDELAKRMADRNTSTAIAIVSRLYQTCQLVELSGADRRSADVFT